VKFQQGSQTGLARPAERNERRRCAVSDIEKQLREYAGRWIKGGEGSLLIPQIGEGLLARMLLDACDEIERLMKLRNDDSRLYMKAISALSDSRDEIVRLTQKLAAAEARIKQLENRGILNMDDVVAQFYEGTKEVACE
jgi:hypothetical protein